MIDSSSNSTASASSSSNSCSSSSKFEDTKILPNVENNNIILIENEDSSIPASTPLQEPFSNSSTPTPTSTKFDPDQVYKRLIQEAPYRSGDEGIYKSKLPPSWLNPQLIKEGQEFVRKNFFSIICAHLGALLYGFSFKSLSTVLLRTGNSSDIQGSTLRYLSTFIHLKTWYESNIVNEYETGFTDIQRVRKMHSLAFRKYTSKNIPFPTQEQLKPSQEKSELILAVKSDLECIQIHEADIPHEILTYSPVVPMSQFDMVMTQFGICSLVYLFPKTLGIRDLVGLDGFIHLWAVVGHFLGIDDEYNIALYPNRQLYLKIFKCIGISSLKDTDLAIITLQKSLVDGVAKYAYLCSVKSLLYFGLKTNQELVGFKGKNLYKIMSWTDLSYYFIMRILLLSIYYFDFIKFIVNQLARFVLKKSTKQYMSKNVK